ncbi:MAG: hypothetical protein JWP37_192 [Mucilaginibacter sp.]|nr:hypothetical protein [Mucilaginibacter sp.]
MELNLKIAGAFLIVVALMHAIFPKRFNWEVELNSLSLMNKQMMQVHTFFVAFTVFLMGLLCLTSSNDLVKTQLGNKLALGLGIFWVIRLIIQFFVYSSKLWKGKRFETLMHVLFSLSWIYLSVLFFYIYYINGK